MFKGLAERLSYRCAYCGKAYWKWICFPCHEEATTELVQALQLQLNVAVLNAGNPELIQKLAVMDGDECIGLVVPDTLEVNDDLGVILPTFHRKKLSEGSCAKEYLRRLSLTQKP